MSVPFAAGFSTREAAKIAGLSVAQVRDYVRSRVLTPGRGPRDEYRFSMPDLVLLRTARALEAQVSARTLRRALRRLRQQLPAGRPLTGVHIAALGDEIVVRESGAAWRPATGQGLLNFDVAELAPRVAPMTRRVATAVETHAGEFDAEDWYRAACDLEVGAPEQAREAYRRVLELDPSHAGAHVNLGRLLHESGSLEAARAHYDLALQAAPGHGIAAFNLGVVLEDLEQWKPAVEAYEKALSFEPHSADAHYNLAALYERLGDSAASIRHLKAFRQLTRSR